ncbi:hypothetical protein NDU88_002332 [Pleurodeles waltl]|uniref:Uncharacterized protein n=1 Tax=Pleurodeles waltl TaxID=8319 RepID=A0AAV7MP25_PLEWA|nr:hypothetical protein NDU88_002332 [Pleurodeles waltl]
MGEKPRWRRNRSVFEELGYQTQAGSSWRHAKCLLHWRGTIGWPEDSGLPAWKSSGAVEADGMARSKPEVVGGPGQNSGHVICWRRKQPELFELWRTGGSSNDEQEEEDTTQMTKPVLEQIFEVLRADLATLRQEIATTAKELKNEVAELGQRVDKVEHTHDAQGEELEYHRQEILILQESNCEL